MEQRWITVCEMIMIFCLFCPSILSIYSNYSILYLLSILLSILFYHLFFNTVVVDGLIEPCGDINIYQILPKETIDQYVHLLGGDRLMLTCVCDAFYESTASFLQSLLRVQRSTDDQSALLTEQEPASLVMLAQVNDMCTQSTRVGVIYVEGGGGGIYIVFHLKTKRTNPYCIISRFKTLYKICQCVVTTVVIVGVAMCTSTSVLIIIHLLPLTT